MNKQFKTFFLKKETFIVPPHLISYLLLVKKPIRRKCLKQKLIFELSYMQSLRSVIKSLWKDLGKNESFKRHFLSPFYILLPKNHLFTPIQRKNHMNSRAPRKHTSLLLKRGVWNDFFK